jgi:hypothetical protein
VSGNNVGTYQWQVDTGDGFVDMVEDSIFSGVTRNVLSFTGATDSLNGFRFRCIVGPCGPVNSGAATMIIDRLPVVETILEVHVCNRRADFKCNFGTLTNVR